MPLFSIEEEACRYMERRFPRATAAERQRMIDDWIEKRLTARGIVKDFSERVGNPVGLRILDAGSGSGGLSIAFAKAGARICGVDIEPELTDISKRYATAEGAISDFFCYDGIQLPFDNEIFDAAVSVSVLEHTDSPERYLLEIFRTLKVGGFLYLAFPNRLWPRETHTKLLFLSYLPERLRARIVTLFKRNPLTDNNLHFYTLGDLREMLTRINRAATRERFVFLPEEGKSANPLKLAIKRLLRLFGISYKMFLPHLMVVLKKEAIRTSASSGTGNRKIRVALMTYAIDRRFAKGSSRYARRLLDHILSDKRFEFYLVHFDRSTDLLYGRAKEILMPKIKLPYGSRFLSLLLFFFTYRNTPFDIIHWFQPRLYPLYWLAPARHIIVTAHGGGDITAPGFFVFSKAVFNFVLSRLNFAVSAVIADSDFGKQEIMKYYHFPEPRVHTVLLGGGEDFRSLSRAESAAQIRLAYGIEMPFILDVARLQPHKNVDSLIAAYILMRDISSERKEKLVIVGSPVFAFEKTYELARDSRYASDIQFIDYVAEEHLNAFYSAASLFVFPSLNEGFGLPVIEAFASGTPVVTSNVTALPEIAGGAALIVPPLDVAAIARAMNTVLCNTNLKNNLIARGFSRARAFVWRKTASETSALYVRLANQRT